MLIERLLQVSRPLLIGVIGGVSLISGYTASVFYGNLVETQSRELMSSLVVREAESLRSITLTGEAMGAVKLAGQLNTAMRTAAI